MDKSEFIRNLLPGNYFITKSMELTKSQTSGTLWYTKKFIVLYYYIFLHTNITTRQAVSEICAIFDDYINSLPEALRDDATKYFYAESPFANLKSPSFRLFDNFVGMRDFNTDREKNDFLEGAKKYYFAFLLESGGQGGVNKWIKDYLYKPEFTFTAIDDIIVEWAKLNWNNPAAKNQHLANYKKGNKEAAIIGMRNDYMAFIRNERQILFFYGFFHSKSSGSMDREFSSLTPVGELALHSNYYELIALWEHQKVKMVSQPVTIDIRGLEGLGLTNFDSFKINFNPYLTILKCFAQQHTHTITREEYQYIVSRLQTVPNDYTTDVLNMAKDKIASFGRKADLATEDFSKEMAKYLLGIRGDLVTDKGCNPIALCENTRAGYQVTNIEKLNRLLELYTPLANYKELKYGELLAECELELKRQYINDSTGKDYFIDPQIKIQWDMYNIQTDIPILLTVLTYILENRSKATQTITERITGIQTLFPNILKKLGLSSKSTLLKELKTLYLALETKDFSKYIDEQYEDTSASIATYLGASLADLEEKINIQSSLQPTYVDGVRKRNIELIKLIKSYNIQRYSSTFNPLKCECCGNITFTTYRNEPYVEYHHLIPFSEYDGADHKLNIIALCPLCHRKLHFLKKVDKLELYTNIANNSFNQMSIEARLIELHKQKILKSYQLEFLLADNAIDMDAYNRIIQAA